jgi:hypothetical protein
MQRMIKIISAGDTSGNIWKKDTEPRLAFFKNGKIRNFFHTCLLSIKSGLGENTMKRSFWNIAFMIRHAHFPRFLRMFHLNVGTSPCYFIPAVLSEQLQNFPSRHGYNYTHNLCVFQEEAGQVAVDGKGAA